jgi:hypothetical protein
VVTGGDGHPPRPAGRCEIRTDCRGDVGRARARAILVRISFGSGEAAKTGSIPPIAAIVDGTAIDGRHLLGRRRRRFTDDRLLERRRCPVEGVALGGVDRGRHGREGYRPITPAKAMLGPTIPRS